MNLDPSWGGKSIRETLDMVNIERKVGELGDLFQVHLGATGWF